MSDKIQISASIVLYRNNEDMLKKVIHSFLNTDLKVKLFLIDNSPTNELAFLEDISPNIEYIFNNKNIGFGAGHNIAIKKALEDSKYFLVLNPDIYFEKGTLETLYDFMNNDLTVGHCMPKILYPDGSTQYLCKVNPTAFDFFLRRFMPSFLRSLFKKRMDRYEYKDKNYDEIMYDIPYLSGCFMLFRTEVLKKVGFFDERIFMYIEDADITRRFLQISRTAYYPKAIVFHHFAKGSHKNFKLMMYTIHGAVIYFNKWGWLNK